MLDLVRGDMSLYNKVFSIENSRAILIILEEYSASLLINITSLITQNYIPALTCPLYYRFYLQNVMAGFDYPELPSHLKQKVIKNKMLKEKK